MTDNTEFNRPAKENETIYTQDTVQKLSTGFVDIYKPNLEKAKQQLDELTVKQNVLIEQLHNENLKLSWTYNSAEMQSLFDNIHLYRNKLMNIKKDMRNLHERSTKLRKRVVRIQQYKEKEEHVKALEREHRIKMEQELIKGGPASGANSSNSNS